MFIVSVHTFKNSWENEKLFFTYGQLEIDYESFFIPYPNFYFDCRDFHHLSIWLLQN